MIRKKYIIISCLLTSCLFLGACSTQNKYETALNKTNSIMSSVRRTGLLVTNIEEKKVNNSNRYEIETFEKRNKDFTISSTTKVNEKTKGRKKINQYCKVKNKIFKKEKNGYVLNTTFNENKVNDYLDYFRNKINKLISNKDFISNNLNTFDMEIKYEEDIVNVQAIKIAVPNSYFTDIFKNYLIYLSNEGKQSLIEKISQKSLIKTNSKKFDNNERKLTNIVDNLKTKNVTYTIGINEDNYIVTEYLTFDLVVNKKIIRYNLYCELDYINKNFKIKIPNIKK